MYQKEETEVTKGNRKQSEKSLLFIMRMMAMEIIVMLAALP
jgi:hypothetical protein